MPKICNQPFDTCNIHVSGEVYSCLCHRWMPQCIGNIFDKDFFKVWHSNKITKIRQGINAGDFSNCSEQECPNLHNLPNKTQDLIAQPLPNRIMLTIDQSCNLACPSCRLQPIIDKQGVDARRILDHVFGFYTKHNLPVEIFCDGYGDIFASRSYLDFLQDTVLPANVRLTITTNGTTIHQYHDLINKIKPNIHSVVISLDAGTANTYQVIRNSNFDQVIENCEWLRHNDIVTHGQFVLQRNNQDEIVKYYELGQRLGFKTTSMQLLDRWGHHTDQWWNNNQVAVDQKLIDELQLLSKHNVQMCGGIKQLIAKHHNLP